MEIGRVFRTVFGFIWNWWLVQSAKDILFFLCIFQLRSTFACLVSPKDCVTWAVSRSEFSETLSSIFFFSLSIPKSKWNLFSLKPFVKGTDMVHGHSFHHGKESMFISWSTLDQSALLHASARTKDKCTYPLIGGHWIQLSIQARCE